MGSLGIDEGDVGKDIGAALANGCTLPSSMRFARYAMRTTWPQDNGTESDCGNQHVEFHGCTPQLHAGAAPCRTHTD
jgi:hypothetical protein